MSTLLQMVGVTKSYNHQKVLRVDFWITQGEVVAIVGPSGSGKSTILQLAGLVDKPTSGEVLCDSKITSLLSDDQITLLRLNCFGFVYQFHHLLPEFSVIENLIIPQVLRKISWERAKDRGMLLLRHLGLETKADSMPNELSGGEQQRVAVARSFVNGPRIVFADEPTGNLDIHNSEEVWNLFLQEVKNEGRSMVIATHNLDLARRCDRIFTVQEGILEECNVMSL